MDENSVDCVLDEKESANYREFVRENEAADYKEFVRGRMNIGTTPKHMRILFHICRMNQWCLYQTFQSLVGAGVFGDDWLQGTGISLYSRRTCTQNELVLIRPREEVNLRYQGCGSFHFFRNNRKNI